MPEGTKNSTTNQYVVSAQLDPESHKRLYQLMEQTGMSKSKLIRVLIMGATFKTRSTIQDEKASKKK